MMLWTLLFIFWTVVPGLIIGWMFRERGRRFMPGLFLGAVCGPFGILAALVFIYVGERRAARGPSSKRGRAVRVFYDIPVVGRLHVSTVWALAGVATFLCLWMVGGVAYEIHNAGQIPAGDERIAEVATVPLRSDGHPASTSTADAPVADSKLAAPTQSNTSSQPQSALLGNISMQPGQPPAPGTSRAVNSSFAGSPSAARNPPGATNATSQPDAGAPPLPSPTAWASATPPVPGAKAPTQTRDSVASEAARDLVSMGHKVHASVSGEGRSTTLSLSGASLTREAGNRLLGNGRMRESLKSAGVRIVVMINGQESWTYIL